VESTPWALIAYSSFTWWASAGEKKGGLVDDEEGDVREDELDRALLLSSDDNEREMGLEVEEEGGRGAFAASLTKEMAIVRYFHRLTGLIFATLSDAISRVDGEGVRRDHSDEDQDVIDDSEEGIDGPEVRQTDRPYRDDEEEEQNGGDSNAAATSSGEDQPLLTNQHHHNNNNNNNNTNTREQQAENDTSISPVYGQIHDHAPHSDQPLVEITSSDMMQMGLDVWSSADRSFAEELVQLWWGRTAVVRGGRVECCGVRVF